MIQARATGKWILAGEHAVLRGSPALVFPIKGSGITLQYFPGDQPLHLHFSGPRGQELKLLAWGVLENAAERLGHTLSEVRGEMQIESSLPIGAGLGASAALCVVVTRWCEGMGWLHRDRLYDFSRDLENLFHGESSGVDIAVALTGEGLKFRRGGQREPIKFGWKPALYLSFCGHRGVTSECVNQVKALLAESPDKGEQIDGRMRRAVELAEGALGLESDLGRPKLIEAMEMAAQCFKEWGLSEGPLGEHLQTLRSAGALAVKPTGSGGGGYVLSLWQERPPTNLGIQFIAAL